MSNEAAKLLAAFEVLPASEQREVLIAILRRNAELPETDISNEQLVAIADELFQGFDREETDDNGPQSR